MQKVYLKFQDLAKCETIIGTTNYDVNDDTMFKHWGELAKETGATATDDNGNEFPVMEKVTGHHVDMYIEDGLSISSKLASYIMATPDNPIHKLR
jgi:hypothetical protein